MVQDLVHLFALAERSKGRKFIPVFFREIIQVEAQVFGQVRAGQALAALPGAQVEKIKKGFGQGGLGDGDAQVFRERKSLIQVCFNAAVGEGAQLVFKHAGLLGRHRRDGIRHCGENAAALQHILQREVRLGHQNRADHGCKIGIRPVQLEKAAGHVHALFQLEDMPGFHPTVQRGLQRAQSGGFITRQLFDRFDGEVGQEFKGGEES